MSEQIDTSSKKPEEEKTEGQLEQEVALKYRQLQQETQALITKVLEIEDEKREHELVLETVKGLEDSRKTWRLVNGVLIEKNKVDLVPDIQTSISNMDNVIKQLNDTLVLKKQEITRLEKTYESVMKQS